MSKKKSPKKAVEAINTVLKSSLNLESKAIVVSGDVIADHVWNDLVEAGYIKARYAFYVGTGKIRNHFVD